MLNYMDFFYDTFMATLIFKVKCVNFQLSNSDAMKIGLISQINYKLTILLQ